MLPLSLKTDLAKHFLYFTRHSTGNVWRGKLQAHFAKKNRTGHNPAPPLKVRSACPVAHPIFSRVGIKGRPMIAGTNRAHERIVHDSCDCISAIVRSLRAAAKFFLGMLIYVVHDAFMSLSLLICHRSHADISGRKRIFVPTTNSVHFSNKKMNMCGQTRRQRLTKNSYALWCIIIAGWGQLITNFNRSAGSPGWMGR